MALQVPFPAFHRAQIPGFTMLPMAGRDPRTVDPAKYAKGLTVDPNTADAAIKFLRQPHDKPFLLVASILNPHDICEYPVRRVAEPAAGGPTKLPPAHRTSATARNCPRR